MCEGNWQLAVDNPEVTMLLIGQDMETGLAKELGDGMEVVEMTNGGLSLATYKELLEVVNPLCKRISRRGPHKLTINGSVDITHLHAVLN